MSDTLTTLAAHSPQAERSLYAMPDWVVIGSTTAATTATIAAVALKQHAVQKAVVSFSAAPSGAVQFKINDGSTVIFQAEIPAATTAPAVYTFERALCGSVNTAMTGTVGDSGGATCTVWMCGIDILRP